MSKDETASGTTQMSKMMSPSTANKLLWLRQNRGVFQRLAVENSFSASYIADVFWCRRKSRNGMLEARLAELGAPGFARKGAA